jgi:hypothetical protein
MTRATPVIFLTLLAIGWGTSMSARQIEVWWDVDRTPSVALVQVQVGTAAGSLRIRIEMPTRVQQKFTAYLVQSSGRRIPIPGSLVGCPRAPLAKNEPIELDSFSWGEPTSRGSSPQATRRPDGDYLVRVAAREPGPCKLELVVPGHLLAGGAEASSPRRAAPGSGSRRAPSRREEGSEAAADLASLGPLHRGRRGHSGRHHHQGPGDVRRHGLSVIGEPGENPMVAGGPPPATAQAKEGRP